MSKANISKNRMQWLEESKQAVFNLLQNFFSTNEISEASAEKLSGLVYGFLCRPGWIGHKIPGERHEELFKQLHSLVEPLNFSNDTKARYTFAEKAAEIVVNSALNQYGEINRECQAEQTAKYPGLEEMLKAELQLSSNPNEAVARAAYKLFKLRKQKASRYAKTYLPEGDPLRKILGLPEKKAVDLPDYDIRRYMLKRPYKAKNQNGVSVYDLLQRAAPFSADVLIDALGKDLYYRYKPVGYADRFNKIVSIQVASSASAYEFNFYKAEIMLRLKTIKNFESITGLHLVLAQKNSP